jgi:hypothetical protein
MKTQIKDLKSNSCEIVFFHSTSKFSMTNLGLFVPVTFYMKLHTGT